MYTAAERALRWRKRHPQKKKVSARLQTLKVKGWTQERFEEKRKEQNDECAICSVRMTLEDKISKTRACADHEHTVPPKPRGLLCGACNIGLGAFQDRVEMLEKAAEYLRKWK